AAGLGQRGGAARDVEVDGAARDAGIRHTVAAVDVHGPAGEAGSAEPAQTAAQREERGAAAAELERATAAGREAARAAAAVVQAERAAIGLDRPAVVDREGTAG